MMIEHNLPTAATGALSNPAHAIVPEPFSYFLLTAE